MFAGFGAAADTVAIVLRAYSVGPRTALLSNSLGLRLTIATEKSKERSRYYEHLCEAQGGVRACPAVR